MRVFFFGAGYCARRLIAREPWIEASGTARSPMASSRRPRASTLMRSTQTTWTRGWSQAQEAEAISSPFRRGMELGPSPAIKSRHHAAADLGGSSVLRPSASMAITAAAGSTRRARRSTRTFRGLRGRGRGAVDRRRRGREGPRGHPASRRNLTGRAERSGRICARARRGVNRASRVRSSTGACQRHRRTTRPR